MKITGDPRKITVTQNAFAKAIGVSQQRVSQLVKEGIAVVDEQNALLLVPSLIAYMKAYQPTSNNAENIDYMQEKARHEKAKREIAELKLNKMQGSVYDARTVELVMTEMIANLRTQLLGMPTKLAPILESKPKEKIYTSLTREIEEKLAELSAYRPELFMTEDGDMDEDGE